MIDYTTQRDHFVEDSLKEMIGITITSEMREIMTSISHKEDWIDFLNYKEMTDSEFEENEKYMEEKYELENRLRMLVSENVDI
jgi:ribosomal protein S13